MTLFFNFRVAYFSSKPTENCTPIQSSNENICTGEAPLMVVGAFLSAVRVHLLEMNDDNYISSFAGE